LPCASLAQNPTQSHYALVDMSLHRPRTIVMASSTHYPEIILFGASMVQWSFEEKTQGLGWCLEKIYRGKANVLNEGTLPTKSYR